MINSLKKEKDLLKGQVVELQSALDVQKDLIDKINFSKVEGKKVEEKSGFKQLIGL